MIVPAARKTSGPAMLGGDSCGCPCPSYVPKNVRTTIRVV